VRAVVRTFAITFVFYKKRTFDLSSLLEQG